jgi:hypothetical protein
LACAKAIACVVPASPRQLEIRHARFICGEPHTYRPVPRRFEHLDVVLGRPAQLIDRGESSQPGSSPRVRAA